MEVAERERADEARTSQNMEELTTALPQLRESEESEQHRALQASAILDDKGMVMERVWDQERQELQPAAGGCQ